MDAHVGCEAPWDWTEAARVCRRQARAVLGDRVAVDDVAQEALLRAWRHREQCRDLRHPWAWMAAIARREALRETALPIAESLEDEWLADPGPGMDVEERDALRAALADLAPADRVLLYERYVLERTSQEIGALHGASAGAVRVRVHRSTRRLRATLTGT